MDILSYTLGKKAGGGSTPVLQDKEVTITQNGESTVTKDSGYDGLNTVSITTNVPQPSGKITITENGTDIDVSSYASADVNVPSGGGKYAPRYINQLNFSGYTGTELNYEIENIDVSNLLFFNNMFYNCSNLINKLDLTSWTNSVAASLYSMFYNCSNLTEIDMKNIGAGVNNMNSTFFGCTRLQKLDVRSINFPNVTRYDYIFGSGYQTNVPSNCLIIVKDTASKQWLNTNFSSYTNVKTVAEYEG